MGFINWLKGVFRKMVSPSTIQEVLKVAPAISPDMQEAIELWESMYSGRSPWLDENTKSLGLATMIASEKARMATLEMDIKVTGDSERAKYLEKPFMELVHNIRKELEYGIALGSFVVKPYVTKGVDGKYVIKTTFANATNFYPISFSAEGTITEAAFIDRVVTAEYIYSKVERHKLENNVLTVENYAFRKEANNYSYVNDTQLGNRVPLTSVPEWAELTQHVEIENVDTMLFAYFKMPQANNIDMNSPLGVSGFSRAVKLIEDADKQYSNLLWEFEGGQMAIDVDRTAFDIKNIDGKEVYTLPKLQDRLYRRTLDLGNDAAYNIFAPSLRDKSLLNGLNSILVQIENVTDLSRGTLSNVNYTEARTATELKILKQRSYSANADVQKELEGTLRCSLNVMDKLCDLYEIVPKGAYEVSYCWDDSIIIDKDAERQIDLIDVEKGLMSKKQYRMKWYGETETQAEDALKEVDEERKADIELQQTAMMNNQEPGEEQKKQTDLQRANESNKVTQVGEKNI